MQLALKFKNYASTHPPLLHPQTAPTPNKNVNIHKIYTTVALAAVEIINGDRQNQQLLRWLDPEVFQQLLKRAEIMNKHLQSKGSNHKSHKSPQILCTKSCMPTTKAIESVIVIKDHNRVRAIAVRLELQDSLWKVKILEIG